MAEMIPYFQLLSSLDPGQELRTATRAAAPTGSGSSLGLAPRSAQAYPQTYPAKMKRLSKQETQSARQAASTVQVKLNIFEKRIKSADVTLCKGDVEQWSSWSDCDANCSQSLQAFRSLQRITGERSRNRTHTINSEIVIETQTLPCTPDCTSGWGNKSFTLINSPRNRLCKSVGES